MDNLTLYERLGGRNTILSLVDAFYIKVLADNRINHFFDGMDMNKIREHQRAFMSHAFGGKASYKGSALRDAHGDLVEKLGLNDTHFDIVAEHLKDILKDMHAPASIISEIMGVVENTRNDVLNR